MTISTINQMLFQNTFWKRSQHCGTVFGQQKSDRL